MLDWQILAIGSAFFAGVTAVLAKIGVKAIPANLATLIRTTIILALMMLLVAGRGDWRAPSQLSRHSLTFLVLSGLTTGLSWLCYYHAVQRGPASLVASIDKLSLVFAVLLSVFLLNERLKPLQWAGVGLITFGAILITFK